MERRGATLAGPADDAPESERPLSATLLNTVDLSVASSRTPDAQDIVATRELATRILREAEARADAILSQARVQAERELTSARAEASRLIESVAQTLAQAHPATSVTAPSDGRIHRAASPTLRTHEPTMPGQAAGSDHATDPAESPVSGQTDRSAHLDGEPTGIPRPVNGHQPGRHARAGSDPATDLQIDPESGTTPAHVLADQGAEALADQESEADDPGIDTADPGARPQAIAEAESVVEPRDVPRAPRRPILARRLRSPSTPEPTPPSPASPSLAGSSGADDTPPAGRTPGAASTPAVGPRTGAWGRLIYRFRWLVLALGLALLTFGSIWGPGVVTLLGSGGFDVPGSESERAQTRIVETVGAPGADVIALYRSDEYTVDDAAFADAVQDAVADVPDDPLVRQITSYYSTGAPALVSSDRHATFVAVQLRGTSDEKDAFFREHLHDALVIDPQVGDSSFGGPSALGVQMADQVLEDLAQAEMISGPTLAILLIILFGGLVAAGLPLLNGAITVVTSLVVLRLTMHVMDLSVFAVNTITVLGLGLSIDYALLIVSRFREEIRAGRGTRESLATTMATAGRGVVVSAVIVAVALSGLMFFPEVFMRSTAVGGISAVAIAALSALTVLPAVLACLGPKVDALRLPLGRRASSRRRHAVAKAGRWERWARMVMRRPVLFAVLSTLLLVAMAVPAFEVKFGGMDERQLPASAEGRQVAESLAADFGLQNEPITVVVEGGGDAALADVGRGIEALPDSSDVVIAARQGDVALITLDYPGQARDEAAMDLVKSIRALPAPAGTEVLVGGPSAMQVDLLQSMSEGLWKMGLLVGLATFVILFWAFGSVIVPLKAMVMTVLTVLASFGVVVLVFQEGIGADLLGFTSPGFIEITQPVLIVAILFGLTTDYEVFLLTRVRERIDAGDDNTTAVATGLQRTGPIITSAALLFLVVILAYAPSDIIFVKLIGVGMAVSIMLDATVVRAVLVPATMRLLGRWNWWAPAPLAALYRRYRMPPEDSIPPLDLSSTTAPVTTGRLRFTPAVEGPQAADDTIGPDGQRAAESADLAGVR
ncbi:MAG: MMPL family transporter [Actinomycetales bacterium]